MKTACLLLLTVVSSTVLLVAAPLPPVASDPAISSDGDDNLVERFLHSDQPPLTSYQALRRLEASSMGGKMSASLNARTYLDADGRFGFDVIEEAGSGLIREHVLRKALETEEKNHNQGEGGMVELTRANYDFRVSSAEDGFATIGLLPRRSSPMLLVGIMTVTPDGGDLVRLEGSPSASPSWWTRRVQILRRYARLGGVRVPIEMASRADVRIAGESTFRMTYVYEMINGVAVDSDR
jgi:hypothetical protein